MLGQVGLTGDLVKIGAQLARIMVELLAGLRPEHEFFEKLGLISAEDLPLPERILRRKEKPVSRGWHRRKGHALFHWRSRAVAARDPLGLVDEGLQQPVVRARRAFR